MKYFVLVTDGAGDDEVEALQGKTPLEVSKMPYINSLAARGEVGMVKTIPDGIAPGSDAANLSVMGYDPSVYLTGRSPLEAASMGIEMSDADVSFRVNLITLKGSGEYDDMEIADHSAGDISTDEARELIEAVDRALGDERISFYTGVSSRHCKIMQNGHTQYTLVPPHDVLGQKVANHLPRGMDADRLTELMKKSYEILKDHPVNLNRIEKGLNPANTIWIWGEGKKPKLSNFYEKYALSGTAISAVDLIKGIAKCAGLNSVDVDGATGTIHTNFCGKSSAAIDEFKSGKDFVYMHLEGPDECSHQGDLDGKIKCLEYIDEMIMKPVLEYLRDAGEDFSVLVVPDHRTPVAIRTHSADPVPFVIYRSNDEQEVDMNKAFSEAAGKRGRYFDSGFSLADYFFAK